MKVDISDDPAVVQPIFDELRNNLAFNIAQSLNQREKALRGLIDGYEALKPEFEAALKEDLGYNAFLSNFAAHSVSIAEVKDLLENFRSWAKPRPVKTPIGISVYMQHWVLLPARWSLSHSEWPWSSLPGTIPFTPPSHRWLRPSLQGTR
jgi:hypothetical protein